MFLIDLEQGRIIDDAEIKAQLAAARPYRDWLKKTQIQLADLPPRSAPCRPTPKPCSTGSRPSATPRKTSNSSWRDGPERPGPGGSDGPRHPQAVLSRRPKLLFDYFKQNFAQVPTRRSTPSARNW